jgi:hypothetical protein
MDAFGIILNALGKYGLSGVLIAILCYDIFYLQRKLIAIIESNSNAMTKMGELLKRCQERCNVIDSK